MLLQLCVATAQVKFEKTTSVAQLLARANKENKLIFIDGYTDWCGWCKVLDEKVFCAGTVADTMNKYFISTKLEMEKDSIGVLFANKYAVMGFPTALVLNQKGQLVKVISGYSAQYLDKIMPIINAGVNQPIVSGYSENLTPDLPSFYTDKKAKPAPDSAIVNSFLSNRPSIVDEVSWNVVSRFYYFTNPTQQKRVLENANQLKQNFGTETVESVIEWMFGMAIRKAIEKHDEITFNETLKKSQTYLTKPAWFLFTSNIDRLKNDSNWKAMAELVTQSITDTAIGLTPAVLNQYAWDLYISCKDKEALNMAITWMENPVLKQEPEYNNLDTYAALLYKSGNYVAAKKAAIKAIEAGRQEKKEDISETESLVKKIDAALLKSSKKK